MHNPAELGIDLVELDAIERAEATNDGGRPDEHEANPPIYDEGDDDFDFLFL